LGSIAKTSLAEAREQAAILRKHALNGRNPVVERDRQFSAPKTFADAVIATHSAKSAGWGDKTADAFLSSMRDHAQPVLGAMLAEDIDAQLIMAALAPIWTAKPSIATKVRQRILTTLNFAHAMGWRSSEAPMASLGALLSKREGGGNMPAMPWTEVPAFVASLETAPATTGRLAMLFLIATAARSKEVRLARWQEVDLDRGLWTRPAEHMKGKREHVVTLNALAIDVLRRTPSANHMRADSTIFASRTGGPISDATLSKLMRDAKLPYVPHGFRSSFRDWAAEKMPEIPDPVAEAALAHTVSDQVVAAYKRTKFLNMRQTLLSAWGNCISSSQSCQGIGL